jgi:hypothetical protein
MGLAVFSYLHPFFSTSLINWRAIAYVPETGWLIAGSAPLAPPVSKKDYISAFAYGQNLRSYCSKVTS